MTPVLEKHSSHLLLHRLSGRNPTPEKNLPILSLLRPYFLKKSLRKIICSYFQAKLFVMRKVQLCRNVVGKVLNKRRQRNQCSMKRSVEPLGHSE